MRLRALALALAVSGAALALPQTTRPQRRLAASHGISPPLWLMRPALVEPASEENEPRPVPLTAPAERVRDPVVQRSVPALLAPPTKLSFDGIGQGTVSVPAAQSFKVELDPADPQGDVGPNHYVQVVNSAVAIFSKTGTLLLGPVPTPTVFTGIGGPCASTGYDGVVLYDPLADRWLISQLSWVGEGNKGPFWECVAISRTPDPTGQYAQYAFQYDAFNDYPKFAVWPDGYYVTYNMFANATRTARMLSRRMCAFDRARMLAGDPNVAEACADVTLGEVSGLAPADFDGQLAPRPGEPAFVVGFFQTDQLVVYRFHVDWAVPENTSVDAIALPAAPFHPLCAGIRGGCVPQLGGRFLDGLGDLMMYRVAYRNMGSYESLIANHNVSTESSSGPRWYEIRDPAGEPFVYQQGTFAPDSNWRWLGSAAMDRGGNIALGYSVSSAQQTVGIGLTGRTPNDPPGVMGLGELAVPLSALGSQLVDFRWGDYSSMSVDPVDDCTFWFTSQYIPFDIDRYGWRTRVVSFELPGCSTAPEFAVWMRDDRAAIRRGMQTTMSISTAALRKSATPIQLSIDPLPSTAGLEVGLDPKVIAPGQSATLTIGSTQASPIGLVPFTIRGTAGAVTLSASGTIAVIDHDFAISTDKESTTLGVGGKAEVRINTSLAFGDPEVVIFSASGVPRGVQASFDPVYVRVGDSATLRLQSVPYLAAGVSNINVTAAGALTTHTTVVRLRTLFAPVASISNPAPYSQIRGVTRVAVAGEVSPGTTLKQIELYLDGNRIPNMLTTTSPAELMWNTESADDGPHILNARATDAEGNQGSSSPVAVWIQNKGECGCSANGGGWEAMGLIALLAAIRRRRSARLPEA